MSTCSNLIKHFSDLKDPRMVKKTQHKLMDILVIAVCASLCRCDDSWEDVEFFGELRIEWFKKFLDLPNGIPSHDTFRRVFLLIDIVGFQTCFYNWANSFRKKIEGETIAIDGKTICGSVDKAHGIKASHIVSAWANENQLVLGQVKVDEKSNEITAIPKILELLDLKGCTVTIDAMGTQKEIAKKIIEAEADYLLGLKGNQGNLHDNVKTYINDQLDAVLTDSSHQEKTTTDADHGRLEIRNFHLFTCLDWLEKKDEWVGLKGIGVVESIVEKNEKITRERRYYITSLTSIERFAKDVRSHWGIESMHWILDVAFNEDNSTRRKGNSPANCGVLKHISLNLLKREKTCKRSINGKRVRAVNDVSYLEKVIWG